MEYAEIWKEKATPLGRTYLAHTARARRISDRGYFGWHSPTKEDGHTVSDKEIAAMDRLAAGDRPPDTFHRLRTQALLTGWATPTERDTRGLGGPGRTERLTETGHMPSILVEQAALAGWATASTRDWRDGRASQETMDRNSRPLNEQVTMLAGWDTPTVAEADKLTSRSKDGIRSQLIGPGSASSPAATPAPAGSVLNPAMSRWLQGYPATWDAASPSWDAWRGVQDRIASAGCAATATQLSHK